MLINGKKIFAFVLIFCLAFCFLTPASAAGEIFVDNASLDVWENGWPEYGNFVSAGARTDQLRGVEARSAAKFPRPTRGLAFLATEPRLALEKELFIH